MTLFHNGRGVIRLGDKTDHGGVVVSASGFPDMGKAIALVGDMVQCPKCKGTFPIATGVSTSTFMGKPMAYHGDKTACGATLISSWGTTGVSGVSTSGASATSVTTKESPAYLFDEKPHLDHELSQGVPYFIGLIDGKEYSGRVDDIGQLPRIPTETAQDYTVLWGDEALAKTNKES